jgi:catechol 2,3-dioxygenase-like lactoylglutathione lyase family enzyme
VLANARLVALVSTTDLARARTFYEGILELMLVEQTAIACVFSSGGTTLRVTLVDEVAKAPYTVLGWTVPDIAEAVRELAERGVETERYGALVQDELGVWTAPSGARVAWFRDPDENLLSITELD